MPAPSAGALSRIGLGGPGVRYGSFAGKTVTAVDSDAQFFTDLPEPVEAIRPRFGWVPFLNNTGQDLEIGDVVCQKVDVDGNTEAALPAADTLYMPWGVVFKRSVPDGLMGYLGTNGVYNAKVLGSAGLTAGKALSPVAGQVYLQDSGLSLSGGYHYPFVLREAHEAAQAVLRRVLVRTHA